MGGLHRLGPRHREGSRIVSYQAVEWVLKRSAAQGGERLVLLVLAHHAGREPVPGADGQLAWEAWPSVPVIAAEAGMARDQSAQRAVVRAVKHGYLQRVVNGAPGSALTRRDRRPNLYRILLNGGTRTAPSRAARETRGSAPASTAREGARTAPSSEPDGARAAQESAAHPREDNGARVSAPTGHAQATPSIVKEQMTTSSTDTHARDGSRRELQRAHDAVRVLASRDCVDDPSLSHADALEQRARDHLQELVQLADRHPHMNAGQLADQALMAAVFEDSYRDPDAYAQGIEKARRALRHLDGDE